MCRLVSFSFALVVATLGCGRIAPAGDPGSPSSDAPPPPERASAPPTRPPPSRAGYVALTVDPSSFRAAVSFPLTDPAPPAGDGAACRMVLRSTSPSASPPSANAGDVAIDSHEGLRVAFDESSRTYPLAVLGDPGPTTWDEAPVHVTAAGADVPAFRATLAPVDHVHLVSPTQAITVGPGADDLVVSWTPNTNDAVLIELGLGDTFIACQYPRAPAVHDGVVPAALLSTAVERHLASGAACSGPCGHLAVVAIDATHVRAGDYDVGVSIAEAARSVPVLVAK